jgi:hypothetical protein
MSRPVNPAQFIIILAMLAMGILSPTREVQAQTHNAVSTPPQSASYRDPASGTIFYVESDRHHVVALDKDGKVLWGRQPATDGNLPPYSAKHPRSNPAIVWIGALRENESARLKNTGSGKFIGIRFNSRQGGVLDMKNSDFTFWGQD